MHTLTPSPSIHRINACTNLQGADTNPDGHHATHKTPAHPPKKKSEMLFQGRKHSKQNEGGYLGTRAERHRTLPNYFHAVSGHRQAPCEQVSQIKHQATLQKKLQTLVPPRPQHQEEGCDPCTQAPLGEPGPLPRLLPAPGVFIKQSTENQTVCAQVVVYHRKKSIFGKTRGLVAGLDALITESCRYLVSPSSSSALRQ